MRPVGARPLLLPLLVDLPGHVESRPAKERHGHEEGDERDGSHAD